MTVFMFPGQGSQQIGMGAGLFDEFQDLIRIADDILGFSIRRICLEEPEKLNQTQYTQPALYVVEVMRYLKELQSNSVPSHLIGHSLGELSALYAAGAYDFATGLRLVKKRGELMARATGGAMIAVMGAPEDEVLRILREHNIANLTIANHNSPAQMTVSGLVGDIEKATAVFEQEGYLCVRLNTSGAFHSPYMKEAMQEFSGYLKDFEFRPLQIPVIANRSALPYVDGEIKETLLEQMVSPVLWHESVRFLLDHGENTFLEIGPGTVLAGLMKRIRNAPQASQGIRAGS
ncbi:MAG TPA: ACP S-malonyltransferase [bacterium]|nr:ACP S-malonyltransferase [bacterium]